jgi:hypothetical protein
MMAPAPIAALGTPSLDQAEIDERPSPAPNASKISDSAAVTKAPPNIAGQDTPAELDSLLVTSVALPR